VTHLRGRYRLDGILELERGTPMIGTLQKLGVRSEYASAAGCAPIGLSVLTWAVDLGKIQGQGPGRPLGPCRGRVGPDPVRDRHRPETRGDEGLPGVLPASDSV
jgi:hypothetical protein